MGQFPLQPESKRTSDAEHNPVICPGDPRPYLRLDNLHQIKAAFGSHAADKVRRLVIAKLAQRPGDRDQVIEAKAVPTDDDWLEICLPASLIAQGATPELAWQRLAPSLCAELSMQAFDCDGRKVHVLPSWHVSPQHDGHAGPFAPHALAASDPAAVHAAYDTEWRRQYRADMASVAALLAKTAKRELLLAWQAIEHFSDRSNVLYYKASPYTVDERATAPFVPHEALGALDRLGFAPLLDLHILDRLLDELDAAPSTMAFGMSVSLASLVAERWAAQIEGSLRGKPDLTRRLFIELPEISPTLISRAIGFADRMHRLGCRVVLTGFGTGIASIRNLLALPADIVKLDGYFLRRAGLSDRDRQIFQRIVELAQAIAAFVVAEGVETAEQYQMAREAGVEWLQGNWPKPPTPIRPWMGQHR
ncbi:EAL domain-containing protein [Novosphingobium album (ex Liu et al. 2023)]|uniref:EAL domain-containing protein n=1 Tax=Novosphingobium album (ex Liu et al. 2023) TaxID=3031130 RepID=A0ABT5WJJ7_9SPHN|nr:EAL domain-containing protein [Novosphingobium album (ex Liu et al. 2023)]MDE8650210.1 EAL domain-containing protein [Novosphingobium album (ex Liu et al. 2023)]